MFNLLKELWLIVLKRAKFTLQPFCLKLFLISVIPGTTILTYFCLCHCECWITIINPMPYWKCTLSEAYRAPCSQLFFYLWFMATFVSELCLWLEWVFPCQLLIRSITLVSVCVGGGMKKVAPTLNRLNLKNVSTNIYSWQKGELQCCIDELGIGPIVCYLICLSQMEHQTIYD